MSKSKRSRNAGITVEVSLSILLTLGVLFLTLGLFSNNLKSMVFNSNIRNFFNKQNSVSKTANLAWGNNPTATEVNVAITGDQGLAAYHSEAIATIKALVEQATPLTAAQVTNLAEALTIKANSGQLAADGELYKTLSSESEGINISKQYLTATGKTNDKFLYYDLLTPNKVDGNTIIIDNKNYKTRVILSNNTIKDYKWTNDNATATIEKSRIANVVVIKSSFK